MRLPAILAAFVLLPALSTPAFADAITVFQISAVLAHGSNSGTATGSVNIDTTTGAYTAADVTVLDTLGTFHFTTLEFTVVNATVYAEYLSAPGATFTLVTPGTSLVGFLGSPLCTNPARSDCTAGGGAVFYSSNLVLPFDYDSVTAGRLTPVETPEPSSLLLIGTGLVGSVGLVRRRYPL